MQNLLDNTAMLYKQTASSSHDVLWIKCHLSAKSVKTVAIFYQYRGEIQILNPLLSLRKHFFCYPARSVSIMFGKQCFSEFPAVKY